MEIDKAFLIVFNQTSDREGTKDHGEDLKKILVWLTPYKQNSILITSPIYECLHSSKYLFGNLSIPFYILEELSSSKDLKYYERPESYSDHHLDFSGIDALNINSLKKYFNLKGLIPIFILDKKNYDNFGLDLKGRSQKTLTFYEFDNSAEKRFLKNSEIMAKKETCSLRNMIRCKFHEKLPDFSYKILKLSEKIQEKTENLEKSAADLKSSLKIPKNHENDYKKQLWRLNETFSRSEQVLSSLSETVDKFLSLSSHSFDPSSFKGKISIKKFIFDMRNSCWSLKIKNSSSENAKNVKIFCIESKILLFSFRFIQSNSKVKAQVNQPGEKFYGKNLVAFIQNSQVSECFRVYPFKLSCIGNYDEGLEMKVKNWSNLDGANLELAVSTSRTPFRLGQDLKYGQTIDEKVRIEGETKNVVVFVASLGRQVSLDIIVNPA
jgi:hypothetical protein